ncbi:MAG: hypothetical protein M3Q69_21495, partial [Acidobacteriota bacterium]|nr:hypothetical protein [Acidobacteriota bacterium]
MPYALSTALVFAVWIAIVVLNERAHLLRCDRFPNAFAKWFAYLWLGAFLLLLAILVTGAALAPATSKQLEQTPFYSLFLLHAILVVFLIGWWLASG